MSASLAHLIGQVYEDPARWLPRQWRPEVSQLPSLHLEDVSAIPFVDGVPGVEQYQHRARVRAADGDLFASTTPAAPGYEDYCRDVLGLGRVTGVLAAPVESPTQVARACARGAALDQLVATARDANGLIVHPYMGIADVWALARAIEDRADAPVYVLAPTPEALWVANDKLALDQAVRAIGLEDVLVETVSQDHPTALAHSLRDLASRHARVGLKRTRCASAMGNQVFDAEAVLAESFEQTLAQVEAFWLRTECEPGEQVLVVQWVDASSSPSTQMWIPPTGHGDPHIDGVYEQLLVGEEKCFLGSIPSGLPAAVNERLAEISSPICQAFQSLGYIGRCSFDFIIEGDPEGEWRAWLTECNGRWGGTSTPMRLVDRLHPGQPRPAYLARDIMDSALEGLEFPEILERASAHLFGVDGTSGRFVFYNVGPLTSRGKLDVVSLGKDAADALHGVDVILPELLGFS